MGTILRVRFPALLLSPSTHTRVLSFHFLCSLDIRVVDVRDEATAAFAADAFARRTGIPGVCVVTAGPGLTNTVTAVKNALLAQTPLIVIGGAPVTLMKGKGALQDTDQLALFQRTLCKHVVSIARARDIVPEMELAFQLAQSGVPGPVFVELPLDLLYPEKVLREETSRFVSKGSGVMVALENKAVTAYLEWHMWKLFSGLASAPATLPRPISMPLATTGEVAKALAMLRAAERPVLLVGAQAMVQPYLAAQLAAAVHALGIPTFLSSAARGLLGQASDIQYRQKRTQALREADVVVLAGVVQDFRLGYGRQIPRRVRIIGVNRSLDELNLNRTPTLAVHGDPARFVMELAQQANGTLGREAYTAWHEVVGARDAARMAEIGEMAARPSPVEGKMNAVALCAEIEKALGPDDVIVADGGDFVGTAAYSVAPRAPTGWLDPGAFGTLGVGGGFLMGANLTRSTPDSVVWAIFGDGAFGWSALEIDSCARQGIGFVAVIGNDACWSQIVRDQEVILESRVACDLAYVDYDVVATGFGGVGLKLDNIAAVPAVLAKARALAAEGKPVVVNAVIAKSSFREGSISV